MLFPLLQKLLLTFLQKSRGKKAVNSIRIHKFSGSRFVYFGILNKKLLEQFCKVIFCKNLSESDKIILELPAAGIQPSSKLNTVQSN